jgi:hypothetical protein
MTSRTFSSIEPAYGLRHQKKKNRTTKYPLIFSNYLDLMSIALLYDTKYQKKKDNCFLVYVHFA